MKIILASGSPRRRELMGYICGGFDVLGADADETIPDGTEPHDAAQMLACRKAAACAALEKAKGCAIVAADTMVVLDGKIYGKPHSEDDAFRMLSELSGRVHTVLTGVCLISPEGKSVSFCDETKVEFYKLSETEIRNYIATGEPMDKAGAYGIQGLGAVLIKGIEGDYYNVMGLPIARLRKTAPLAGIELGGKV